MCRYQLTYDYTNSDPREVFAVEETMEDALEVATDDSADKGGYCCIFDRSTGEKKAMVHGVTQIMDDDQINIRLAPEDLEDLFLNAAMTNTNKRAVRELPF